MLLDARDWFCFASVASGNMYVEDITEILTPAAGVKMVWSSMKILIAGRKEQLSLARRKTR